MERISCVQASKVPVSSSPESKRPAVQRPNLQTMHRGSSFSGMRFNWKLHENSETEHYTQNTKIFIFIYSVNILKNEESWNCVVFKHCVNLRIQYEYKKIRTRNNSVFGHLSRSQNVK